MHGNLPILLLLYDSLAAEKETSALNPSPEKPAQEGVCLSGSPCSTREDGNTGVFVSSWAHCCVCQIHTKMCQLKEKHKRVTYHICWKNNS